MPCCSIHYTPRGATIDSNITSICILNCIYLLVWSKKSSRIVVYGMEILNAKSLELCYLSDRNYYLLKPLSPFVFLTFFFVFVVFFIIFIEDVNKKSINEYPQKSWGSYNEDARYKVASGTTELNVERCEINP